MLKRMTRIVMVIQGDYDAGDLLMLSCRVHVQFLRGNRVKNLNLLRPLGL